MTPIAPQLDTVGARLWHLWRKLSAKRHRQFLMLLILMLVSSFAEVMTLGALLPFLGALAKPEMVLAQPMVAKLATYFALTNPSDIIAPLTLLFVLIAAFAGVVRLALLWATTRLTFIAGADLSMEIYRRTLYQPYQVHMERNSSEIISSITNKTNAIMFDVLLPTFTLINSAIMLVFIFTALVLINPVIAFSAAGGFGMCYVLIGKMMHRRLLENGQIISSEQTRVVKVLQEGLGGIRDVLIDGTQPLYCDIYRQSDQPLRRAQARNLFIGSCPRYLMEALGIVAIAGLAFWLNQHEGIAAALPVLGALALGAQRLLPAFQQGYNAWSLMMGQQSALLDALALLDQPMPDTRETLDVAPLVFEKQLQLRQLSFRYTKDASNILHIDELLIPKGSRVGFVGATGSGKSTLLDIIMGLLPPSEGELLVDGTVVTRTNCRAWQRNIAHVPQNIFLADGSFTENIALGIAPQDIDMQQVRHAAEQAQLAAFIETLPQGYAAGVGERGVRLSGGQRQRIGLARALYKNANLLVLDEATSALDTETETSVMQTIAGLRKDITILIIAHRLSTLSSCDFIVTLKDGRTHITPQALAG